MQIEVTIEDLTRVKAGAVVINAFEGELLDGQAAELDKQLGGAISQLVSQGEVKGKLNELTLIHTFGKVSSPRIAVCGLGKKGELTVNRVRQAVGETCRWLRQRRVETIATQAQGAGINGISPEAAAQAIAEGAILGLYAFRKYITRQDNDFTEITQILIAGNETLRSNLEQGINRGRILAEAANAARDMVNEPSNVMTPTAMADMALSLGKEYGLEVTVLERDDMERLGMGGLLGVAQGSRQPPKFIVLKYTGDSSGRLKAALVGKGITFDSGGISIKPSEKMEEMKGDMAGGAAVMMAISAVARLKPRINAVAVIPATENMPGGHALKPGDVLKAMNGKTIEIISTDAEGRLILADALSYSAGLKPEYIIDVATLTGACMVALGDVCTGALGNNQGLIEKIIAAGTEAGELIWQLPMYDEYKEQIKSSVADMKNVGGRYAGAITAAKFLAEFIDSTPWLHLDIAGTAQTEKDKGFLVKGATGVPVRTLTSWVLSLAETS